MPVTFEGVSEYRRNFVIPQTISDHTHSPPAPGPQKIIPTMAAGGSLGPHPQQQDHVTTAGLSSAKMAVIHEPAFTRKRKPVDHGKKVTFTADYAEHGSPINEDDKAIKFRAGFRRVDVPIPTEYNLQYTWKTSAAPDHTPTLQGHTPLLQAESLLNSQTSPSNYPTNQQQLPQNGHHHNGGIRDDDENIQNFEQLESRNILLQDSAIDGNGADDKITSQLPDQKATNRVPKLQIASNTNSPKPGKSKHAHSLSKAAKKKLKSHHHHHSSHHHTSKKHKGGGGHHKVFMSEYKRQFKVWPISSSTSSGGTKRVNHSGKKEKNENVAGSPQVLTDSSDPRLLKHKPLPTHMPIARWGSEYSANFMSPLDFVYERGAWKGAPHPELFMKADGSSPEHEPSVQSQPSQPQQQSTSTSVSWFDQLIELRQRADEYRTRAQRVHFPPYHLSIHHHDNTDQDSFVTTLSMTSSSLSDDQTSTETSSPTSDSTEGIHVSRDLVDQTQSQHLSQNQGRLGFGKPQKTHQVAQVISMTAAAPLGKRVGGDGVQMGDGGHTRMMVEDMEESWDSETLTDDGSLSRDGAKPRSSTPPQASHLKAHGAAELSKYQEPSVEVGRSKIIPRPNAFSLEGDGEIEGRVPTPELRKSVPGRQSRHHLDTTTPSGGGLLISPSKPEVRGGRGVVKSVELPYPPVSPKYRRDMKSKAPIYPPPPREVGNGRQKGDAPTVSSTTNDPPPQSVLDNRGLRNVPTSSGSPYHTHCVPCPPTIPHSKPTHNLTHAPSSHPSHPHTYKSQPHKTATTSVHVPQPKGATVKPQTSYSGPVRKLLFESHSKQPSSQLHTQHMTKKLSSSSSQYKSHTKTSALSAVKSSHSNMKSCETCGSYLRSPAVLGGGVGTLGVGHSGRMAPPNNLSQIHSDRTSALQASRHQSQLKVNEIRSKLASHTIDPPRAAPTNMDDYQLPDSGLGSSNRGREGGQRLNGLGAGGRRARDVDELSLSSLSLSSCSVASDVLQKAQERRDRFWTQPKHITAS